MEFVKVFGLPRRYMDRQRWQEYDNGDFVYPLQADGSKNPTGVLHGDRTP